LRYEFRGLQPNSDYHVSLFAVNPITEGSVAFGTGASFRTESGFGGSGGTGGTGGFANQPSSKPTINLMKDAATMASYLNPTRGTFQLYEYPVKHFIRELIFHIQPCSGYIRVKIFKDGKLVRMGTTEMLKTFQLTNLKPLSSIEIKVENDDNDAKIYRIWASEFSTSDPYPKLPVDTSVKVLEHSRTCNSVTLAWLGSTEKHNYCLYKREEQVDYFKKLILEEHDSCTDPRARMDMVFCRADKVQTDDQYIMKATVPGLKPDTTYRFDLYAEKPGRDENKMSYRTVWVKTKQQC